MQCINWLLRGERHFEVNCGSQIAFSDRNSLIESLRPPANCYKRTPVSHDWYISVSELRTRFSLVWWIRCLWKQESIRKYVRRGWFELATASFAVPVIPFSLFSRFYCFCAVACGKYVLEDCRSSVRFIRRCEST